MTKTPGNQRTNDTIEIVVVLVYAMLCLLVGAIGNWIFHSAFLQAPKRLTNHNAGLVDLPVLTRILRILSNDLAQPVVLFRDAFTDNQKNWRNSEDSANISVRNGTLQFGSLDKGDFAIADGSLLSQRKRSEDLF